MRNKESRVPKEKASLSPSRGIPVFSVAEKLTAVLPIKVQPSLKKALKQVTDNASEFGRLAIIEKLSRMEEETFE